MKMKHRNERLQTFFRAFNLMNECTSHLIISRNMAYLVSENAKGAESLANKVLSSFPWV